MIVVDASAFIELIADDNNRAADVDAELGRDPHWAVSAHCALEVMNGLRGLWLSRRYGDEDFDDFVTTFASIQLDVWPTAPLIPRIRELAPNANAYDASHIALAEELAAKLVTMDKKLGRVPGIRCTVVAV